MDVSDDDFVEEEGSPNREQDDITTAEAGVDFVARSYQLEIFEKAKSQNALERAGSNPISVLYGVRGSERHNECTSVSRANPEDATVIAYLDTAAGKTYISVLLVKHLWDRWRHRNPAPLAIFIVPTVILVEQQALVFKQHTPLRVGLYHGARSNIDFWDQGRWEREFGSHDILVMTAQILLDMLIHGFVSMERLGLLIFDECHMAAPRRRGKSKSKVSNHPYCQIMLEFYHAAPLDARPRVFGMTASPSKGFQDTKETPDHESLDSQIAQHFRELEHVLDAKIHTMSDREELERHVPAPKVETVLHAAEGQQGLALTDRALHLMDRASSRMAWRQRYERAVNGLRRLEQGKVHELVLDTPKLKTSAGQLRKLIMHVLALFQEMGPWCAAAVVETVLSGEDASEGVIEALDLQSGIKLKKGAVDAEGCRSVEEVQQVVLQAVAEQEISREILDDMRQPHIAGLRAIRDLLVAFTTVLVPEAAAPQLLAEIDGATVRKAAVDPRLLERDLRRLMAQIMAFTPEDELRKLVTGHKDAVLSPAGVPLVTNKVAALMGVLFRERARMAAGGSAGGEAGATRRLWCCLVFCKMRITAMALHVLLSHRSLQAEMDHLSSDYLVGQQGGEEATGMMRHSIARQQTVVERLRLGQLNCVFATNVAEQGLDIRQCQLVVAYDLPSSSGELIQQRGRARVKCARYVCLISMREQGRDSKKLHLLNYVIDSGIRQALATSTVQRPPELAATLAPAKAGTYKTPAGAKISMHAAKQLLNQYCVLLDSDPHTCLQPMFSTRRTAEEPPLYQSRLVMPPTCPLRRCKGEFMPTAAEAKSSACLAAVRKLHQLGELDDQLVPACRDVRDNESVERDKQVLQLPEEELRRMRPQEMWSWIGGGKIPNAMIQRKHPLLLMPPGPQQESCAPPMPFASPAARQALAPAPQHRARSKKQHKLWLYAFATQLKGASNATGTGPDGPGGPAAAQVLPLGMLTQRRLPPEAGASFTIWPRPSAGACAEDLDAAMEKQTARMLECRELPLSAADVARLQHYHRVLLAILYGARRNTMMASAAAAKLVRLRLRYTPASEPGAAATVSVRLHVRQSMCEMWDLLERHRKSVAAVPTSSSKKQCDEDLHASVALSPVPEGAMRVVPEEEWCKSSCGCWYLLVPVAPAAEAAADVDWRQVQMTEAGAGPMVDLVNMQECQRLWKVGTGTMSAGAQRQVEKQRHQLLSSFDEQLQDRVVLTTHGDQVRVYRYAGMCESITLESTFLRREAGALREVTYQDYFRGRYGMTHLKPRQPLVGLVHHHHRVCGYNLLNPPSHTSNRLAQRKEQSSSQSSHRRRIQMPVELCLVHPIPSSVWASLRYIPCFLYRMESLLLAHQLTEALAPPWTTQRPPVQEVLEAITAPVARETFDMEAYETLGDTYLKYGVVAYLFMRHPAARESSLSPAKHKIVSNGSLFNLCRRWGIHHYIRAWPFHFSTWYPPGLDESPPPVLRVVQGKVLADVVEAVIGVWFELLGLKQGLQFLQHLQVLPPGDCLDWSGSQADWEYISQAEFRRYLDQEGRSRAQPLLNIQDDIQMPESKEELLQVLVSGSVRRKSAARPVQRAGDGTGSSSSEDADSLPGAPGGGAGVGRAVEQRKRSILEQFRDETLLLHPASTTAALWPGGAPVPCGAPAAAGAPLAGQRAGVGAGGPQQQQQQQQQEGGARSKALRAETAVQAAAAAGLVATTRRSLESCGGGQATDRWMQGVESRLDYVFRYPFLARSAFTHASWVRPNPPSYQRLEFLGDAVMEVLLTQWLFHRYRGSHPDFGPDLLTNMRCLMVNNDRLARCTLLRGLHRFLNEHSVSIRRGVNRFRDSFFANLWKLEQQGPEASRAETRKLALAACGYRSAAAAERAPKVLGDLVESSVGAVFLDSDQDVQETRRVVLQLMAPLIDAKDCPMHPVKRLLIQLNKQGIQPRFEAVDMEGQQPGRYTVVLMVGSQRLCRPCTSDSARHARIVAAQTVLELMRQSPDYVHEVLLNDRAPGGGPAAASSGSSGGGQGAEEGSASDVQMADLEGGAPLLFTHGEAWEGSKRRKLAAPRLAGGEEGITLAAAEDSDSSGAGRDADWQYSVPVRRGAATDVINQLRAFAEGDAYRRGMDSLQAADAPPLNQVNAFTDAINGVMPY